jgi:hypothetical protein
MDISFKKKEDTESRTVTFDMPETLADLQAKFGDDAVAAAAKGAFVISLQALARRHIEKSDAEIQGIVDQWNPNERSPAIKKTAYERASSALQTMSPEEKRELLNRLKAQLAAGGGAEA